MNAIHLGWVFPGFIAMAWASGCASSPPAQTAAPGPTGTAPAAQVVEVRPAPEPRVIAQDAAGTGASRSTDGRTSEPAQTQQGAVEPMGASVAAASGSFDDESAKQDDPAVDLEAALDEAQELDERLKAEAHGRPLRLLISLDAKRPLPVGSVLSITLSRLAGSSDPPVPVAARRMDVAGRMGTVEVELPLRADRVTENGRYAVSARVDAAGHLTAITTTPSLLEARDLSDTVELELESVPGYVDER